VFSNDTQDNLN